MFVDRATIEVRAGKGGDGAISFRRERSVPRGGPDGGDGGRGGSVILIANRHLNSLDRVAGCPAFLAEEGQAGRGRKCHGRGGKDLTIAVPCGTIIRAEDEQIIADLTEDQGRLVLARGGKGGKGNVNFATAIRQAPKIATRGEPGQGGRFHLELKLIAQVGLVGLPNAGKSTLLRAVSRARPAVGAYPFTTLTPHLGVAAIDEAREVVLADIPGLIEGASDGAGLGDEFLRHVERTGILLHLIDITAGPVYGSLEPLEAYAVIRKELLSYKADLAGKRELIALNKIDACDDETAERWRAELAERSGAEVFLISGIARRGLRPLLFRLAEMVEEARTEGIDF